MATVYNESGTVIDWGGNFISNDWMNLTISDFQAQVFNIPQRNKKGIDGKEDLHYKKEKET